MLELSLPFVEPPPVGLQNFHSSFPLGLADRLRMVKRVESTHSSAVPTTQARPNRSLQMTSPSPRTPPTIGAGQDSNRVEGCGLGVALGGGDQMEANNRLA